MDDTTADTPPATAELAAGDMFMSLTGFDELAIVRSFSLPLAELREHPTTFLRALVFVDQRRRGGLKDRDAYQAAMDMPFGAVQGYFPDDDDDEDSPQGEDDGR